MKVVRNPANANNIVDDGMEHCDCSKLCVKKAKIKHLKSCSIVSKKACIEDLEAIKLSAQDESVNNLCVAVDLKAKNAGIDSLNANHLCSQNGTINQLCVNDLTVGNLNHCVKWRAAVTFDADQLYTLGAAVNWNTIIDDPNGNISIGPFAYTVPGSGYYTLNFHLDTNSLSGASVISGVPVGILRAFVNGSPLIDEQSPFVTFSDSQTGNLNGLVLLTAGDILTMKYEVLIVDPVLGLIPYAGTVVMEANGSLISQSFFTIHYLSSLNCTPGQTCIPCPPVEVPCQPMTIICDCDRDDSTMPGACSSCV